MRLQLTVVSSIREVKDENMGIVFLEDTARRPSIMKTVGEQKSRCVSQIVEAPLHGHAKGLHSNARKALVTMLLVPIVRKVSGKEHAFLGIAGTNDQILATLKLPHFSGKASTSTRIVRTPDMGIRTGGKLQRKIQAIVTRIVFHVTTEVKEVGETLQRRIAAILKDVTRPCQGPVGTGRIKGHVEVCRESLEYRERESRIEKEIK